MGRMPYSPRLRGPVNRPLLAMDSAMRKRRQGPPLQCVAVQVQCRAHFSPRRRSGMRKLPFLFAAVFVATLTIPAHTQNSANKGAVKPADPELKVVLDSWNDIGRKLIAMAEDFPEDKYDFKPTPAQRSFAEQLLHAAGANYYFINPVMGKKAPAEEDPK